MGKIFLSHISLSLSPPIYLSMFISLHFSVLFLCLSIPIYFPLPIYLSVSSSSSLLHSHHQSFTLSLFPCLKVVAYNNLYILTLNYWCSKYIFSIQGSQLKVEKKITQNPSAYLLQKAVKADHVTFHQLGYFSKLLATFFLVLLFVILGNFLDIFSKLAQKLV